MIGRFMVKGASSIDVQTPLPPNIQKIRARTTREYFNQKEEESLEITKDRSLELIENGHGHILVHHGLKIIKSRDYDPRWLQIILDNGDGFLSDGLKESICKKIVKFGLPSKVANRVLIEKYYKLNDFDEIIELSERVNKESGDDYDVIQKIIDSFKKSGKSQGLLEFIPSLGPYSDLYSNLMLELALAYFRSDDFFHSLKIWKKVGYDNLNTHQKLLAAKSAYYLKNFEEVSLLLSKIHPSNYSAEAAYLSIRASYMNKDWRGCLDQISNHIQICDDNKKDIEIYRAKAVANLQTHQIYWFNKYKIGV